MGAQYSLRGRVSQHALPEGQEWTHSTRSPVTIALVNWPVPWSSHWFAWCLGLKAMMELVALETGDCEGRHLHNLRAE